jgi:hypothetical protein
MLWNFRVENESQRSLFKTKNPPFRQMHAHLHQIDDAMEGYVLEGDRYEILHVQQNLDDQHEERTLLHLPVQHVHLLIPDPHFVQIFEFKLHHFRSKFLCFSNCSLVQIDEQ